ncbi:hypothetical protein EUX98_g3394 [Antrodiella citrinella]|uniref:Uncharacterized protein n=1 Tax=Antrodiella citrinella TaxID=2447956 RepID=A0A4S4MWP0_9APHY|nr:hypothetical protein EUX98_g3394 [Antrodiella citrinella]
MSKTSKRPVKGNKHVTDYFTRSSVTSSSTSASDQLSGQSQPTTSSQPASAKAKAPATSQGSSQRRTSTYAKDKNIHLPPSDVISISSGSTGHISVSSDTRSHITISSSSSSPVVVTGMNKSKKAKESSSSEIELVSIKESSKTRMAPPPSRSRTSVRRVPQRIQLGGRPLKRKLELDSDSDGPIIEKAPYLGTNNSMSSLPPVSSTSSPSGPLSSLQPLTPSEQLHSLPSDDAASVVSATVSKRIRLTPPVSSKLPTAVSTAVSDNEADIEDVIPSSQSVEHELIPLKQVVKDPVQTRMEVDRWRQETAPGDQSPIDIPADHFEIPEVPMDVDIDAGVSASVTLAGSSGSSPEPPSDHSTLTSAGEDSQSSEGEVSAQLLVASQFAATALSVSPKKQHVEDDNSFIAPLESRSPTPPPTEHIAAPTTPIALDTATKTQNIIDEVRRARMVTSSPEVPMLEFQDELSSSDDDFYDTFFAKDVDPQIASSPLTSPSSFSPEPDAQRYSLRKRSPVAGPSGESSYAVSSKMPQLVSVASNDSRRASSSKKANPLDALLKEKHRVEKRGGGTEAFAAAEAAVAMVAQIKKSKGKGVAVAPEDIEFANEEDAMRFAFGGSYGVASHPDDEDDAHEDFSKYLNGKKGAVVGKILQKDREGFASEARMAKATRGVPLWFPAPLRLTGRKKSLDRKVALPSLPVESAEIQVNPILRTLEAAVKRSDVARVGMMLRPECMAMIPQEHYAPLFDWLYDIAFKISETTSINSVFRALEYISAHCEDNVLMSHDQLSMTLLRLGAQPLVLGMMDVDAPEERISEDRRDNLLVHVASLLVALFRNHCLSTQELPDFIESLLLVALDVATFREGHDAIVNGVNAILACIEDSDAGRLLEAEICRRVVSRMCDLEPINKAYLLSLFNRGCPQNARIARWIAYVHMLQLNSSVMCSYSALPPLRPIVALLSPAVGSMEAFDIPGKMQEEGYFEELNHNVDILNIALTDIDEYVRDETKAAPFEVEGSGTSTPNNNAEKSQTELEAAKTLLDKLHGKIADTRAAHLDRSRVKAALQHLSFRVHYQRLAWLRSATGGGMGKPHNIRGYFGPTPIPKPTILTE